MPAGMVRPRASRAPHLGAGAVAEGRAGGWRISAHGRVDAGCPVRPVRRAAVLGLRRPSDPARKRTPERGRPPGNQPREDEMSDTTDARTIAPDTAEELHDADNGEMAGEWCREADIRTGSSRWMERRRLVLRHDDGTLWGLPYAVGLTENQDSDYPWRDATGPLALTQMWRTERLAVRYATRPPADQHLPQPLVDRVYDSLLAALGEHDLILCPTTETGPDNGIESGHVLGISERIADAVLVEPAREVG